MNRILELALLELLPVVTVVNPVRGEIFLFLTVLSLIQLAVLLTVHGCILNIHAVSFHHKIGVNHIFCFHSV